MYDVLDVCRYVISYYNKNYYGLSNLKLQKILYFLQAQFLLLNMGPLFKDEIEAWDFGPVVPTAYWRYMYYGAMNIAYVFYDPYKDDGPDVILAGKIETAEKIAYARLDELDADIIKMNLTLYDIQHDIRRIKWVGAYVIILFLVEFTYFVLDFKGVL